MSPQWHLEHRRMMDIERLRADFMRELENDRRQFESRDKRLGTRLTWAAVILGAFQLIAAFVAPIVLKLTGFGG
jgi:hypothetical protein